MQKFDDNEPALGENQENTGSPTVKVEIGAEQSGDDWANNLASDGEEAPVPEIKGGVNDVYQAATSEEVPEDKVDVSKTPVTITTTHPNKAIKALNERYPSDLDRLTENTTTAEQQIHTFHAYMSNSFQDEARIGYQLTANINGQTAFSNKVETKKGNIELLVGSNTFKNGSVLTGRKALLTITSHMGLSSAVQLPDVDSGIRVAYRSPSADEFVALDERLARYKDQLGYYTMGLSHSFNDSYTKEILFNFMVDYIIDCNVVGWKEDGVVNVALLRRLLPHTALRSHHLALLAAYYSRSYPLVRVCTAENNCDNVIHGKIYFQHSYWILEDKLTPEQLRHMTTSIDHKYTPEEILKYQASLKFDNSSLETVSSVGSKMSLNFGVPSFAEDLVAIEQWVSRMRLLMSDGKRQFQDANTEAKFIRRMVNNNQLTLFTNWIKSITLVDGAGNKATIEDPETIKVAIEHLSKDEQLLSDVLEGIWSFIDGARKSVIGVAQHICPKCKRPQEAENIGKEIVPFDATAVFFTLLTPTVSRYQKIISEMPGSV